MKLVSKFLNKNSITLIENEELNTTDFDSFKLLNQNEIEFFKKYNGATIENGLFRFPKSSELSKFQLMIGDYFEEFKNANIFPFGYDWMGRVFSIGKSENETITYMFDPATGEHFELEQDLFGFLNEDLTDYRGELLDETRFLELIERDKTNLKLNECFGYDQYLFLGGEDSINNIEKCDIEVYWESNSQLAKS